VVPALASVSRMRQGGARDEVLRLLETARAMAAASGRPHGVRISPMDSTLTLLVARRSGDVEEAMDAVTGRVHEVSLETMYKGVSIESFANGDGSTGQGVLWFDYEGVPHTRTGDGVFIDENSAEASLMLSSGVAVVVHPLTGMTEAP